MTISRRDFLFSSAALGLATLSGRSAKDSLAGLRIGVTDWNLRKTGQVEAVAFAAQLGFDGVEVSLGRNPINGKLPLDNQGIQDRYLEAAREHGIGLAGTCLDILHVNYLKNDPLGQKWVADGIPITKRLNARVMLLPFFGNGALETRAEMTYVADVLRELAPEAEKAGVILGLENTISARDNVDILERIGSPAALVYYDVGNSTNRGFNILEEIRWLGADRICQFHLKDNPHYLGEGTIDFPGVIEAVAEIGFKGFANLETSSPSDSVEDDMQRNLAFIRNLITDHRS